MRTTPVLSVILALVACDGTCPEAEISEVALSVAMPDEHGDGHVLACACSTAAEAACVVSRQSAPCAESDVILSLDGDGPIAVDASPEVVGEISADDASVLREACATAE